MLRAIFSAILFVVSYSANAVVINSNLIVGQTYSGSLSGSFDLASQLGEPVSNFQINSATVRFDWNDDASDNKTLVVNSYNGVAYGAWGSKQTWGPCCDPDYRFDRTVTTYYSRFYAYDSESVALSISGVGAATSGSVYTGQSAPVVTSAFTGETLDHVNEYCSLNFFGCRDWDRDYYFNQNYNSYADFDWNYGGPLFQQVDLVADGLLAELLGTGSLSFGLNLTGDAVLVGATLLVDITRLPVKAELPAGQVPEPMTFALVSIGLVGLGFSRRRRS